MSKAKQAILRAIAIKLEVETHKKYRRVLTKIAWAVYLGLLATGTYNSYDRYNHASDIMGSPAYVDAKVKELPEYISDSQSAYQYTFTVDGNDYKARFVTSHKSFDSLSENSIVKVVYREDNPSLFGIAKRVQEKAQFSGIFTTFIKLLFFSGITVFIFYLFFTQGIVQPIEDYDDDDADEPELNGAQ